MFDLMDEAIKLDSGDHLIWQTNRGLLSPLYLPDPEKLLTLPTGVPRWQTYQLTLPPQQTQNLTVNFGRRSWMLAIMGNFDQDAGFSATFFDSRKKRNIFGNTREFFENLVGTGQNPAWLTTPYMLEANSPLFIRVTNIATVAGSGQLVIYSHMEGD